jgi:hypothetical protein
MKATLLALLFLAAPLLGADKVVPINNDPRSFLLMQRTFTPELTAARDENKLLMLNLGDYGKGDDKLKSDVLDNKEFKEFVKENLVVVNIQSISADRKHPDRNKYFIAYGQGRVLNSGKSIFPNITRSEKPDIFGNYVYKDLRDADKRVAWQRDLVFERGQYPTKESAALPCTLLVNWKGHILKRVVLNKEHTAEDYIKAVKELSELK